MRIVMRKPLKARTPFFFEVEIWLNVYPFIISLVVKLTCLSWNFAKKVGNHLILILNEYELLNLKIYQIFTKSGKIDKKSSFFKFFSDEFFITKFSKMRNQFGWRKILMVYHVVNKMKILMKFVWKSCFFLSKNVGITP